jgi:glycerol uptake facilitator protein
MLGGTIAGAINYAIYKRGIKLHELAQKIVRGTKGSYSSASGAFGMMHNKMLLRTPGALMVEVGCTAALAFLVFSLTDPETTNTHEAAPALIGLTVTGLAAQFAHVTGCGMNPMRDLGPRLVTAATGWGTAAWHPGWWIYTVGPMAGALLGAGAYQAILKKKPVKESKL